MNKLKFTCLEFNIITNILSKFVFHGMRQHIKNILKKKKNHFCNFLLRKLLHFDASVDSPESPNGFTAVARI